MKERSRKFSYARGCACVAAAALILSFSPSGAAQKNKKQKNSDTPNDSQAPPLPVTPQIESNTINEDIGEMLGAFQVGNADIMHKYYSDDCTFVQSTYDPPVIGWPRYAALYEREKAAFQGMQLIRRNTDIFVHGDMAWASYQWEFDGMTEGRPFATRGQTTLVLTKVNGNWLIVHNHTNEVMAEPTQQTSSATPASPGAQPTGTTANP